MRENKNNYCFKHLSMLVMKHCFKMSSIFFSRVGHTHAALGVLMLNQFDVESLSVLGVLNQFFGKPFVGSLAFPRPTIRTNSCCDEILRHHHGR